MKKNIKFWISVALSNFLVFFPTFIHAAVSGVGPTPGLFQGDTTLQSLIKSIIAIMASLVPLLIGAAVVFFLYGVLVFIAKSANGDAEGRQDGIKFMIFGIIGIAVMVSVWGLVSFVTNTLGTSTLVPQFKTSDSQTDIHSRLV
ncbi:TPA: hypothetical protein DCQ44_02390 [Candidatus Taylorbacteria bacterium]|nr:hypothetical protein [Candidatus Taylorbacteria bacterium]